MIWRRFVEGVLLHEGSTRAVGLLRVLLALLAWGRFADDVLPVRSFEPERLLLSVVFFLTTSLMLLGFYARISTAAAGVTLLSMVFWFGHNGVEPWGHHHTTILALAVAILALTPCGGSYSVDRWLAVSRAERAGAPIPAEKGPLWAVPLLGFLVSTVYFWSAVDKTTWAFLSGDRLEAILMSLYFGSDYPDLPGFGALCALMGFSTVVLEFVLPIGLWIRPWQKFLMPLGLVLHALFYWILPVSTFTLTMWALYLAFLDPEVVHRAIDRMNGHRPDSERASA